MKKEDLEKEFDSVETCCDCEEEVSTKEGCSEEKDAVLANEELQNQFLRLQADFANYKRRMEKDRETLSTMALEKFVNQLLPIMDNFERALSSFQQSDEKLYEGIQMIYSQVVDTFEKNGITQIKPVNEAFDPNYHYAILMDDSGEKESGTVTEVLQLGYLLKDKVLRPATVKVAQ